MNSKFKFYEWHRKNDVAHAVVVVSNKNQTICANGGLTTEYTYDINIDSWRQTNFKECLLRFKDVKSKNNFIKSLKLLGFSAEPVVVTKEQKEEILNELIKMRARNGDSAHKFGDDRLDILFSLVENKKICTIDNRSFWLEE